MKTENDCKICDHRDYPACMKDCPDYARRVETMRAKSAYIRSVNRSTKDRECYMTDFARHRNKKRYR